MSCPLAPTKFQRCVAERQQQQQDFYKLTKKTKGSLGRLPRKLATVTMAINWKLQPFILLASLLMTWYELN